MSFSNIMVLPFLTITAEQTLNRRAPERQGFEIPGRDQPDAPRLAAPGGGEEGCLRSQARHPGQPAAAVQHRQPRAEPGGDPLVHAPFFNGLGGAARQLQPVPCLPDTKGQGLDRVPVQPELEGSLPLSPVDLRGAVYGPARQLCRSRQRKGTCPSAAPEGQTGSGSDGRTPGGR